MGKCKEKCDVCGKSGAELRYCTKYDQTLCNKHRHHMKRHGKILNRTKYNQNEYMSMGDKTEIILYNMSGIEKGKTIIDTEDIEKCKKYKWCLRKDGYVTRSYRNLDGTKNSMLLHRYLMNMPTLFVDHIDLNPTNNSKKNLRLCNYQQNTWNKLNCKKNTSGYSGVSYDKRANKWRARIYKKHEIYLGLFNKKEDAIAARLAAEKEYFGEFAPKGNNNE